MNFRENNERILKSHNPQKKSINRERKKTITLRKQKILRVPQSYDLRNISKFYNKKRIRNGDRRAKKKDKRGIENLCENNRTIVTIENDFQLLKKKTKRTRRKMKNYKKKL